jgi:hypothetical protein
MPFRRTNPHRSSVLIHDSCTRIASAHEVLAQARQAMARQRYLKIVCAWCQQTIRWERCEQAARGGQISHSICFACCAAVFQELDPGNAMSPLPTKGDMHHERCQLRLFPSPKPGTSPQNKAALA